MRAKHKYKKIYLRRKGVDLFYPLFCEFCSRQINKDEWYYTKKAHEAHKDCVPENLIDNENQI